MKQIFIVFVLSIFLVHSAVYASPVIDSVEWRGVNRDIEHASIFIPSSFLLTSHIDLFRIQKRSLQIVRASEYGMRKSDVKNLCQLSKNTLCINGSFFDEQSKPLGLIVQNGILIQKLQKGGDTLTGVLLATPQKFEIVHRADFSPGRILNAIQAGPRLIARGEEVTGLHESTRPTRRSGVCVDTAGRLILFTVRSNFFGIPVSDLQRILLHKEIGCVDALNLDGGSSTQFFCETENQDAPLELEGEDKVPLVLGIK